MLDGTEKLQDGIYLQRTKEAPLPGFFSFLLLDAMPGKTANDVDRLLQKLWDMYARLKDGKVNDLGDTVEVPKGELKVLLGFGRAAFKLADPAAPNLPPEFEDAGFNAPIGGQPIATPGDDAYGRQLSNSGIVYAPGITSNPGEAAFALQFTAETPLAVERAIVETWKLLNDQGAEVALRISAAYTGTKRDDRRSWIDFHDGLSNLKDDERASVVPIRDRDDHQWTVGGTYLAFVRLAIDLAVWRGFSVAQQEGLVGRAKISGCPLMEFDPQKSANGCPLDGNGSKPPAQALSEPPSTSDATLKYSHVQRANHHEPPPGDPLSLRIFRQGYPYLESTSSPPGFRTGLNFVSFQDNPWRLLRLLMRDGWFGGSNFGGENGSGSATPLLTAYAAGLFFVPPRSEDASYPGRTVLSALVPV
jgi:Dyp-type peroxidase family